MVLPFEGICYKWSDTSHHQPPKTLSTQFLSQKPLQTSLAIPITKTSRASLALSKVSVSTRDNESLPSIITELQKEQDSEEEQQEEDDDEVSTTTEEQQPKRLISDHWPEIHGQDDWVNMLDPIDSLLRSELLRYGEMAQTCYDAFDYDPFSKNCGSCRFVRHSFFDRLGLNHIGYDVTRYLYATSNINLPNFFKKSRWPQVWSRNANWIGYVSVSNDEMSQKLGRRDITIAWRGPRVGNVRFKDRLEVLGVKVLRVVNVHDTVPKVPGIIFNEHVPTFVQKMAKGTPWSYSHVGVELALDHKKSPFLKDTGDFSCFHNLEAHLHLLDGYHGKGKKFLLTSGRDPALVNKASDFLKDHYLVPPFWRQDENKGMVRSPEGRWMQPERPKHDDHPHDIHYYLTQLGLVSDQ
ncbi:hypothetical protein AQUCO_04900068v1 [Aquilegia coerulea]|uniref:Fungal lipase-type domain-containing protein n=1 Tax=Aquilegia coerulea TaxID=218851 RepID=A0A2G5CL00_AQUCA|nr:hypothetical protein AQUCO_04900068v1 [Aquilegia coerulea]